MCFNRCIARERVNGGVKNMSGYRIKYNRTTNHIDGIEPVTPDGKDTASEVGYYAVSACPVLSRSANLATSGKEIENLGEALLVARTLGGRQVCRKCESAAVAALEAAGRTVRVPVAPEAVEAPQEAGNVTPMGGGKVHKPGFESHGEAFPKCRTGGATNAGTRYRKTSAPVDCRVCLSYDAPKVVEVVKETGPVPPNFLELAKHGNTPQARAYWQRRVDNWGK